MANNLLLIRNRITGDHFVLAKSFGEGWELRLSEEKIEEKLRDLFDNGSFGNCFNAATDLELITGNDPRFNV